MYDHNFTYIKSGFGGNLSELIAREISFRKAAGQNFCKITCGFSLNVIPKGPTFRPSVDRLGFYTLRNNLYLNLKGNDDCSILRIDSQRMVKDNVCFDLKFDADRLGEEFCRSRTLACGKVYLENGGVDGYICYHGGEPVGTCEFFLYNGVAKVDNFTVLPREQRKGYGTSILKFLIRLALLRNARTIYLVTDEDDTAKDMYRKFGFERTGEITDMLFML